MILRPTLKPTSDAPTMVGYVSFHQLEYPPMRPWQLGQATATPSNTIGDNSQPAFNKRMPVMKVKPVIRFQINNL